MRRLALAPLRFDNALHELRSANAASRRRPRCSNVAVETFDFLSDEYRALHERSCATAFQAPRWLDALHRDVGTAFGAKPITVAVRDPSDAD
jgi:hypothetical protein